MANHSTTPEGFRTAAYLAARERLDFRRGKTRGAVKCEAPNRRCGNRCIPPDWDCRLKGEGNDGHLTALGKGSDPVAGLANVERGLGRIGKGIIRFRFSEIESGRKALARGTAKLSPGDMKKKQEIKENVDKFLGYALIPAAAIVGAGLLHGGLKNFKGYREGPGRQVDDSAKAAINLVRTNIPGYGQRVRQRQAAGPAAVSAMGRVARAQASRSPESWAAEAGQRRTLTQMVQNQPALNNEGFRSQVRTLLNESLSTVDGNPNKRTKPSGMKYDEWHRKSLSAFWTTKRSKDITPAGDTRGSVFSVHATNDLLATSYNLQRPTGGSLKAEGKEIIGQISQYFKATGETIRTSMREYGLDPKDPTAVRRFISTSGGAAIDNKATQILVSTVTRTDYDTQARVLYRETLSSFDQLFARVAQDLDRAPSIDVVRNRNSSTDLGRLNELRQRSFYNDAVEAHSSYLGEQVDLRAPIYGPYTGLVARKAYHARFVAGPRERRNNDLNLTLTRVEATTAGAEVARAIGAPEPTTAQEALRLLNRTYGWDQSGERPSNALGGITLMQGSTPRRPSPPSTSSGEPRAARRRRPDEARLIASLLRQVHRRGPLKGQPVYTPETAKAKAQELLRRDARADAYALVREDYTKPQDREGKPCGKSFVPRQAKCSKPTSVRYADPEAKKIEHSSTLSTVAKAAAVAGVVAGGVLAAKKGKSLYNNRRNSRLYTQNINMGAAKAIRRLSQDDIRKGIAKVPARFRPQAEKLVGKAKSALAYIQADSQGFDLKKVNNDSNFSVWRNERDDKVLTIGSVGDTLVMFNADRQANVDVMTEGGRGVGLYEVQFTTDASFTQKQGLSKDAQAGISSMLKAMNKDTMESMPKNAILKNTPFGDDGLGRKRAAIYKRFGYKPLKGVRGNAMFATLSNGKIVPIDPKYDDFYADLIKGKTWEEASKAFSRRDSTIPRVDSYNLVRELLLSRKLRAA